MINKWGELMLAPPPSSLNIKDVRNETYASFVYVIRNDPEVIKLSIIKFYEFY